MNELAMRALLCESGRRLWQRGLASGSEACLSSHGLCTPAGASIGHLRPDEIVPLKVRADDLGSLHLWINAHRPGVGAVLSAAPEVVLAFGLAGEAIGDNLLPEAGMTLGSVALVSPFVLGVTDPDEALKPILDEHKTFILSHSGALVLGKDAQDCLNRLECLNRCLRAYLVSRLLGSPKPMPDAAFQRLLQVGLSGALD